MFLFLKLVLAHLVADFVLQFEELYQLKVRSFLGHILHVLIHGAVTAVLILPFLKEPLVLVYLAALMVEHLVQDLIKYRFTQKFPQKTFVYYTADQICHFLMLAAIFFFPVANEVRGFPGHPVLNMLYANNTVTLFCIFYVVLTFAGSYTLNSFYRSYVKTARPLHWITSGELAWAILERGVIASVVVFMPGPVWVIASLSIGLLRLPFPKLRSLGDFIVSAGFTLLLSYLFILIK